MIITQLLGGLGNQMFQYAVGRRLAIERKTEVLLDCHLLNDHSPGRHAVNRNFALDIFNGPFHIAPLSKTLPYSAWGLPRILRGATRILRISNESRQTRETEIVANGISFPKKTPLYLAGLWQSADYFQPIEQQLRDDFRFRTDLPKSAEPIAAAIRSETSVCVHVRRTDYLSHANSDSPLGFVGLDYYRKGTERIAADHADARYFVFSDDLDWSREHLTFIPNAQFVDDTMSGYKDSGHLQLMSFCKLFLIPNSTFSWWAAWLSTRDGKQVYVPAPWYRDPAADASGLYVTGWKQIQVPQFRETGVVK